MPVGTRPYQAVAMPTLLQVASNWEEGTRVSRHRRQETVHEQRESRTNPRAFELFVNSAAVTTLLARSVAGPEMMVGRFDMSLHRGSQLSLAGCKSEQLQQKDVAAAFAPPARKRQQHRRRQLGSIRCTKQQPQKAPELQRLEAKLRSVTEPFGRVSQDPGIDHLVVSGVGSSFAGGSFPCAGGPAPIGHVGRLLDFELGPISMHRWGHRTRR